MDNDWWVKTVALVMVAMMIVVLWVASHEYDRGYKQGQIDALNGSIHWQLQRQADGQMLWTECENVCEEK